MSTLAETTTLAVPETFAAVRTGQSEWAAMAAAERVAWVRRYGHWLLDHQEQVQRLLQAETGKPWGQAGMEVPFVLNHMAYNARLALSCLDERRVPAHSMLVANRRQALRHVPYPVVGVISPWNFPVAISLLDSMPALLAGAAVVLKPSELTPNAVSFAVGGWAEIGAPAVFAVVTGGPEVGAAVVEEADYVQFTGSTRTGRRIGVRCAELLKPCSLELGGKDAMLVLEGADVRRAVNAAIWGGLANSGQMCTSVERIYVHDALYDTFVSRLVSGVEALRVGVDDDRARYDVGPLASLAQGAIVLDHLEDAVARGARILIGGTIEGRLAQPTVLVDVDNTMRCLTEETFGPLLPVVRVMSDDEAVEESNRSSYGLSAHVFGPPTRATERLARRLHAGAVNINDVAANLTALALPQRGWNDSGIGERMGGSAGILKYTRSQAIVTARVRPHREPTWFPYTRARTRLLTHVLRIANRASLAGRSARIGG